MIDAHYDIIILGAGPAGLAAAIALKNSNHSVLLVEKNNTIGPKACAGGLTNLNAGQDIPLDKTRAFPQQHIVIKNKKHIIDLAHPIRTITRFDLGQHQLNQLKDAPNITVLTQTRVSQIQGNFIVTEDNKSFSFDFLIGADGSNSIVRKSLGLTNKQCVGLYYHVPEITQDCLWYLNHKLLGTGYIWVFPHKEFTNIGVYFNPDNFNAKKARIVLEDYIKEKGFHFNPEAMQGGSVCYNYEGYNFGNIFLAGDAAGLTSKGTGEGISYALTSGTEISKLILQPDYEPKTLHDLIRIKQRQDKFFKILETVPYLHAFLYTNFVHLMHNKKFQAYFGV